MSRPGRLLGDGTRVRVQSDRRLELMRWQCINPCSTSQRGTTLQRPEAAPRSVTSKTDQTGAITRVEFASQRWLPVWALARVCAEADGGARFCDVLQRVERMTVLVEQMECRFFAASLSDTASGFSRQDDVNSDGRRGDEGTRAEWTTEVPRKTHQDGARSCLQSRDCRKARRGRGTHERRRSSR